MFQKAFTVAEANALLPDLEMTLQKVERRLEEVQRASDSLQVLDLLWGDRLAETTNPDFHEAETFRLQMTTLMAEIEAIVAEEITDLGLRFPAGGLEHGLIDFPTTWAGRWVLLCWHRGESELEAWHEIDGGYAGRQPLTEEHIEQMGHTADQP